jgi:hypothetical protein
MQGLDAERGTGRTREDRLVFQGPLRPLQQAFADDRRPPFWQANDMLPATLRYEVLLGAGAEGLFEARAK